MFNLNNSLLLQPLASLGNCVALNINVDDQLFRKEIETVSQFWKPYNPRKKILRYGISLTSIDGKLGGNDLDSLTELNKIHRTNYQEKDFRIKTEAVNYFSSLRQVFEAFDDHLGRCHILKLDKGGHFPPHRDAYLPSLSCYRLLILGLNCGRDEFYFTIEDERVHLDPWIPYFIDTRKVHAAFSFVDNAVLVVLNIIISEASILKALSMVKIK